MTSRYGLREDQWNKIRDLLPGREGAVGVTARDNRLFVEAVLYRYRAGIPWRDLPERFGGFRNVHKRYTRWAQKGVWEQVFKCLCEDSDNEYAEIDRPSSVPTNTPPGRGGAQKKECIGHSRGGLSTKILATGDAWQSHSVFLE